MGEESLSTKTEEQAERAAPRGLPAADERLREMTELIMRVRHEINNPLTGIIGQAQLLLRDTGLDPGVRRRVAAIEHLAQRLREAVAELRVVQNTPAVTGSDPHSDQPPRGADDPPRH